MTGATDPRRRFVGLDTTPATPPRRVVDEGGLHDLRPSPGVATPLDPDLEQAAAQVRRRIPTAVKILTSVVGCFTALCVAIWAMGGFRTRNDLDQVIPGQQFSVGPVSFTLDRVEVHSAGSTARWFVRGTCRYELDSSSPGWQAGMSRAALLGVHDPDTNELFTNQRNPLLALTEEDPYKVLTSRNELAPDMGAVGCVFDFPMPESTPTTPTRATVIIHDLQRMDARVTSGEKDSSKVWGVAGSGHRIQLPVVVV